MIHLTIEKHGLRSFTTERMERLGANIVITWHVHVYRQSDWYRVNFVYTRAINMHYISCITLFIVHKIITSSSQMTKVNHILIPNCTHIQTHIHIINTCTRLIPTLALFLVFGSDTEKDRSYRGLSPVA